MTIALVKRSSVEPGPFTGREVRPLAGKGTPLPSLHLSLVVTTVPVGETQKPVHAHMAAEEVIYVAKGEGLMWVDEEIVAFEAEDAIYIPVGAKHTLRNTGDTEIVLVCAFSACDYHANRRNYPDLDPFAEEGTHNSNG